MNTLLPNEILRGEAQISPIRHHYDSVALGFLRLVWRRKLLLLGIVAAFALTALLVIALLQPRYTADVTLQLDVGQSQSAVSDEPASNMSLDAAAVVLGETRILQSRSMARRVVERLDLLSDPAYRPDPSGGPGFFAWTRAAVGWVGAGLSRGEPLPLEALKPGEQLVTPDPHDLAALELLRHLNVENDGRSYLIYLSFTSPDPKRSAEIADAFAREYLQSRIESRVNAAQGTSTWLASQIQSARADLQSAEREMQDFRGESGTVEMGGDGASVLQQRLRDATAQLGMASAARLSAETRHQRAAALVASGNTSSLLDFASSPQIQRLLESEALAKRELAELSSKYGARHPEIVRATSGLEDIQARIGTAVEGTMSDLAGTANAARLEEQAIEARVDNLQRTLIEAKWNETRLKDLQNHADGIRDRLKILTANFERAKALSEFKPVSAEIVVPAEVIPIPSWPNPRLFLGVALVAALGLGIAVIVLGERLDTGFRSSAEVRNELDVRPLGMLPELPSATVAGLNPYSATPSRTTAVFWEAVRSIGAAAGLTGTSKTSRLVLVTSSLPGEGKSLLIATLAGSLASAGSRVLVIDGGLDQHRWLEDRSVESLEDLIADPDRALAFFEAPQEDPLSLVRRSPTSKEGLGVIAGPSFEGFIREARKHFDVIILEGPAVMLAADTLVLGRYADTLIHVVRWHSTKKQTVKMAIARLKDLPIRVSGAALTCVDMKKHRKYSTLDECYFYSRYRERYERAV